ncbi:MAG TPA: hypothetical protein VKQ36_13265 [Ktedonobacterales bacterium]|nr:hypothetical protein [Ktedonobacterales bacterium]
MPGTSSGSPGESEAEKAAQSTGVHPADDIGVGVPTPGRSPTPVSQRAVIPMPVDRGRTQPADLLPSSDAGGQPYEGYGRYPIPYERVSGDAETIRTLQPPMPGGAPTGQAIYRPLAATPVAEQPQDRGMALYHAPTGYAPSMPALPGAPSQQSPRLPRWLLFASVATVFAVLLAGVGFFVFSYLPTGPVRVWCADLTTQRYDDAYTIADQSLRARYSQTQFAQDLKALDLAEGTVTTCQGTNSLATTAFPLGTSQFTVTLTRQSHGELRRFTGAITVAYHGGWQISGIATALLGVNLGALAAANAYCAALRSQNYTQAYHLLGASARSNETAQAYSSVERLHNQISGVITTCGVTAIGRGNTDIQANLTLGITRSVSGAGQGAATLAFSGGVWSLTAIPMQAEGPDVGPYLVGQQFCADLAANHFDAAYDLFTPQYQAANPRAQFVGTFQTAVEQGATFGCDTPDFTTYRVNGSGATYVVPFVEALDGLAFPSNDTLTFARQSDGRWLIANSDVQLPF